MIASEVSEEVKLDLVADIETIQSQLAKAKPNGGIIRAAWESIANIAVAVGLAVDLDALHNLLSSLWQ